MTSHLSKITCIADLQRIARRKVPKMFYDYADTGSWWWIWKTAASRAK